MTKLILDKSSVNLSDLLLSCLEFSSPQLSHLIMKKCLFANENINQCYSLSQRLIGFGNDDKGTLLDCFLYKCNQYMQRKSSFGLDQFHVEYLNLLNSLMNADFKIFNLKLLERNTMCQTLLFYDLKGE